MLSNEAPFRSGLDDRGTSILRLYSRHEHEIYSFIVALVPNWADADEIMQDTCLRLWQQFDKFEEGTNFVAWAVTVARYLVLAFRERTGRERAHFSLAFVEALAQETPKLQPAMEGRKRALAHCMESLPAGQREVLSKVYEAGMSIRRSNWPWSVTSVHGHFFWRQRAYMLAAAIIYVDKPSATGQGAALYARGGIRMAGAVFKRPGKSGWGEADQNTECILMYEFHPSFSHTGDRSRRSAFTVPEMLAVVAIITIILSILLPNLTSGREVARNAICKSQQRQVGLGFLNFAVNNSQRMPGVYAPPYSGIEPHKQSWLGNEAWPGVTYEGAIVKYIGGPDVARTLYRCPSLEKGAFMGGVGSNGFFDYSGLLVFTGARRQFIPGTSTWRDPQTGVITTAPTPLVVEEDPAAYINNGAFDPGHSNIDRIGTWHKGGGNYIAFDGHSEHLKPAGPLGPTTWDWQAQTPSGAMAALSSHASGYGGWDLR